MNSLLKLLLIIIVQEKGNFKITWKKCANMPDNISVPQVVKIANEVYVGGGMRNGNDESIFKYSLSEDTWTLLPDCPTYRHSLSSLDNKLIAIGGKLSHLKIVNLVYTLNGDRWIIELPPMPTPRYFHSSITYQNQLIIAAGGTIALKNTGKTTKTNIVEIYIKDDQWYTTKHLPFPQTTLILQMINSTCYSLGGVGDKNNASTVYATISSLLANKEPAESTYSIPETWSQLKADYPLACPALAEMFGRPAAFGGFYGIAMHQGTTFISIYDKSTNEWIECKGAKLPVPLYRSTVLNLDNDQIVLVGGQYKSQQYYSTQVFIGNYHYVS